MTRKKLISLNIDTGTYKEFLERITSMSLSGMSKYVCVANVHMLIECHKDKNFAQIVSNADLITPDGMPLCWTMKLLYGKKQERVAGMDLLPDMLERCKTEGIPVYFYGSTPIMLEEGNKILKEKYPGIQIAGSYSPPFRALTPVEENEVIGNINKSGAKLIIIILGCPKQERWMASMKGRINATMIGIGGAYPVLLGLQQRAPKWMRQRGLEWLYRLGQEPQRLFKRYMVTNTLFLALVIKEYFKNLFSKKRDS